MEEKKYRLPETSVVTENCLSKDYIFEYEARSILKKQERSFNPDMEKKKKKKKHIMKII